MGFIAAGVGALGSIGGALIASGAQKKAASAANAQNAQMAQSAAAQQQALMELFANQQSPADAFKEIFTSMPELLAQVLPPLREDAKQTATDLTASNLSTYDQALSGMFPQYKALADRRLSLLSELDPNNLGKEEMAGASRKLAPYIPSGTVDPSTGAVQGGVTSPVALYRNMVSGMYSGRRDQYLGELKSWLGDSENAALRQQEKASSFLLPFLNLAGNASSMLTGQTMQQQQGNIASQTDLLKMFLSMPRAQYDPSAGNAAIAQGVTGATKALASINWGFGGSKAASSSPMIPSTGGYGISGGSSYDPSAATNPANFSF